MRGEALSLKFQTLGAVKVELQICSFELQLQA